MMEVYARAAELTKKLMVSVLYSDISHLKRAAHGAWIGVSPFRNSFSHRRDVRSSNLIRIALHIWVDMMTEII
jgi:hypothetical protein